MEAELSGSEERESILASRQNKPPRSTEWPASLLSVWFQQKLSDYKVRRDGQEVRPERETVQNKFPHRGPVASVWPKF